MTIYNRMFTLHGVIMVWFFLVPSIPNTLGNFLLPLMIGAKDVAFPKLNLLSWYIFVIASLFHRVRDDLGRGGHRLDVLHAAEHGIFGFLCIDRGALGSSWSGSHRS